jgi:predicted nucleotidyltransferase
MATKTIVEVVLWLEDLFDRHRIVRSYGGAIARNFFAEPRLTRDVDLLVLVSQTQVPALVKDLVDAGASALEIDGEAGTELPRPLDLGRVLSDLRGKAHMTALRCFGVRVEIFVPWHPFDHEVLRRSLEQQFDGRTIRIHSPEDLIVYKKVFNRSKDIEDIKAILAARAGTLDLDRIRSGASRLLDESAANELEELIRQHYR